MYSYVMNSAFRALVIVLLVGAAIASYLVVLGVYYGEPDFSYFDIAISLSVIAILSLILFFTQEKRSKKC